MMTKIVQCVSNVRTQELVLTLEKKLEEVKEEKAEEAKKIEQEEIQELKKEQHEHIPKHHPPKLPPKPKVQQQHPTAPRSV